MLRFPLACTVALLCSLLPGCQAAPEAVQAEFAQTSPLPALTPDLAQRFAELSVKGIVREYPNKPGNVMQDAAGVRSPRQMHPAFYGSFDWHSSVHGHWMLIRLLRTQDTLPESLQRELRQALSSNLDEAKLAAEVAYFEEAGQRSFERMYGWAWALRLAAELELFVRQAPQDQELAQWREAMRPLEALLVDKTYAYLPLLQWPNRVGVHQDTGFAIGQALDYAQIVGNTEFDAFLKQRARDYYQADFAYPARYEPAGEDFFSSGLNEADLMRRVLSQDEFSVWLDDFFPDLRSGQLKSLLEPVHVTDITDGKIVHLAGLDLSRAWCWHGIASALPDGDPRKAIAQRAVRAHADAGLGYVFSGDYAGEHWLASFAVYLVTEAGLGAR